MEFFIVTKQKRQHNIIIRISKEVLMNVVVWALLGTTFTFLMTTLGAATVFLFRKNINVNAQSIVLGFASGVMIAASVWSLLMPAIEEAKSKGQIAWVPAAGGFVLGGCFLLVMDKVLDNLYDKRQKDKSKKGKYLMIMAVTLHNIPEGMAVGLAFSLAQNGKVTLEGLSAAIVLAVGIGIQNLPEGAGISLPLLQEGKSVGKSFLIGMLSGVVEPIFGVAVVLVARYIEPVMPWLLSFAAGAMIFVVVSELIPDSANNKESKIGTIGVMAGFMVMMILDVALG